MSKVRSYIQNYKPPKDNQDDEEEEMTNFGNDENIEEEK